MKRVLSCEQARDYPKWRAFSRAKRVYTAHSSGRLINTGAGYNANSLLEREASLTQTKIQSHSYRRCYVKEALI